MGNTVEIIAANKNKVQAVGGTLAAMGVEKGGSKAGAAMAGKVAGYAVTPAIWAYNYQASGSTPDSVDLGLYAAGFIGSFASAASIGTSVVKAFVDDDIEQKLQQIKKNERSEVSKFIKACYRYSYLAGPGINAMTIASKGGTAWKHPNGLWVYLTDIRGYLVPNFQPREYVQINRPKWPLQKNDREGSLVWEAIYK